MSEGDPTTRWSLVLRAQEDGDGAAEALGELVGTYRGFILSYIRLKIPVSLADQAEDLAHGFIESLLVKGKLSDRPNQYRKFRPFLRKCMVNFVLNHRRNERAGERGAGAEHVSFEALAEAGGEEGAPPGEGRPDKDFDRSFAEESLRATFARLEADYSNRGQARRYQLLLPFLSDHLDGGASKARKEAVAQTLGITYASVNTEVSRLRERWHKTLLALVEETVADPSEVQEEIRFLLQALEG